MTKLNWNNLTKEERIEYMKIQMSTTRLIRRSYLPDDCGECTCCGQPSLGIYCPHCLHRWQELRNKLEAII
jgi:hypothetical protein